IPGTTKTDADVPAAWHDPATERGAQVPRIIVERTAAQHPHLASWRSLRVPVVAPRVRPSVIPIRGPLPHVAQHVVQIPGVRFFPAHLVRGASAVAAIPCDLIDIT